jgi:hypothetical protein
VSRNVTNSTRNGMTYQRGWRVGGML